MGKGKHKSKATLVNAVEPTDEQFSMSIGDPAFAAWWFGTDPTMERVTPYTILGLSAVLRSVSVISTTIAGLPLRTYERHQDGERHVVPSVFDDPLPGIEGLTAFAWVETVLIHLLLWREAFLWHESMDSFGNPTAYRPICPDAFQPVKRVNGKRRFRYTDPDNGEITEVGQEQVTYIPGPSIDGVKGHPWLWAARNIFSAALSGDKAAATTLSQGIRLAGLVTPAEGEEIDETEGQEILKSLRPSLLGSENAGNIAFINRHLKLDPWTPTNVEAQWHETRTEILGEIGRLFGMPPHLLNDTEKQTSWGTGVAEQNLGLARFTLMGWSSRVEQLLSRRTPPDQFCEFDYKGLLQGTPAEEIRLVIEQLAAGLVSLEFACRILNLPPPNDAQRAVVAPTPTVSVPIKASAPAEEPDRFADIAPYVELQTATLAALAAPREPAKVTFYEGAFRLPDVHVEAGTTFAEGSIAVTTPPVTVDATTTIAEGAVQVDATTTVEAGAIRAETVVNPPEVTVVQAPEVVPMRTVIDYADDGVTVIGDHEEPL